MKSRTIWTTALILSVAIGVVACISKTPSNKEKLDTQELTKNQPEVHGDLISATDVQLTNPLNAQWINEGKGVYEVKCQACHKLKKYNLACNGMFFIKLGVKANTLILLCTPFSALQIW